MPELHVTDLKDAGVLIQFALHPDALPATNVRYRELLERYIDRLDFRRAVDEIAHGLGLWVLDYDPRHGIVLAPTAESVFEMKGADWRITPGTSFETRALDGLVQVGIVTTLYPRAADLEDEAARPPITVEDVDATLRQICARLEEEARNAPDPEVAKDGTALGEAWRHYVALPPANESGRRGTNNARALIERNLEFLRRQGCFARLRTPDGREAYQTRRRYEMMVREFSTTPIYDRVTAVLANPQGQD